MERIGNHAMRLLQCHMERSEIASHYSRDAPFPFWTIHLRGEKNGKLLVFSDFADATTLVAQTFGWVVATQLFDQCRRISRNIAWKFDGIDSLQNDVVRSHWIGTGEWRSTYSEMVIRFSNDWDKSPMFRCWFTCQQFKHEHTQRPIVGTDIMSTIQNNFRCHIFRCAAKRPRLSAGLQFLGKSKVDQFHIAFHVEQ